jgi:hypothetical protein
MSVTAAAVVFQRSYGVPWQKGVVAGPPVLALSADFTELARDPDEAVAGTITCFRARGASRPSAG